MEGKFLDAENENTYATWYLDAICIVQWTGNLVLLDGNRFGVLGSSLWHRQQWFDYRNISSERHW